MKVGFDGRYAEGDLVGVGKYIANLVGQLVKKNIKCVIFYSKEPKYPIFGKNISQKILNSENRYLFEQIKLPLALKKEKVDIYHALGNLGVPLLCPVPAILTVHDIIPLLIKNYFNYSKLPFITKFSYLFRLKTSIFRARRVIVDSEFTKKTLVENLGVKPIKIKVIYLGAPKVILKTKKLIFDLEPGRYVLNHGGIDIRKNLDRLIRAFAKVVSQYPNLKLVITGENKTMRSELDKIVKDLGLENLVVFPGYVKEEILESLIKNASCICFPSLIEGFGMPVLEGFAFGVPVITSSTSSLSEIANGAAFLVNPENEEEIALAILKVVREKKTREELIKKGRERIKDFSWEKTAEEVLKVYREV